MLKVMELANENSMTRVCCQEMLSWLLYPVVLMNAYQDPVVAVVPSDYIPVPHTRTQGVVRDLVKVKAT
jgi:hypothetical protein